MLVTPTESLYRSAIVDGQMALALLSPTLGVATATFGKVESCPRISGLDSVGEIRKKLTKQSMPECQNAKNGWELRN